MIKSVKEAFYVSSGYPFRKKIEPIRGTGSYVIQMKNICEDEGILWDEVIESEVSTETKSNHELMEKDILFIARGTRNVAVTLNIPAHVARVYAAPQFFVLRLKDSNLLPEYVSWYFNSHIGQSYWTMNCEGSVTKSIRRNVLDDFKIITPEITQQKVIVKVSELVVSERLIAKRLIEAGRDMMKGISQQLIKCEKLND